MKLYYILCIMLIAAVFSGCSDSTTNPLVNGKTRMELLTSHIWYFESGTDDDPAYILKFNSDSTMYFYIDKNPNKKTGEWHFISNETQIFSEETINIAALTETTLVLQGTGNNSDYNVTYKAVYNSPADQPQINISGTLDIIDTAVNLNDYQPVVFWQTDENNKVYLSGNGSLSGNNTFQIIAAIPPASAMLGSENNNLAFGFIALIPKTYTAGQLFDYNVFEIIAKGGVKDRYIIYVKDKNAVDVKFVSMFDYQNGLHLAKKWIPFDENQTFMPVPNEPLILTISSNPDDFMEKWN